MCVFAFYRPHSYHDVEALHARTRKACRRQAELSRSFCMRWLRAREDTRGLPKGGRAFYSGSWSWGRRPFCLTVFFGGRSLRLFAFDFGLAFVNQTAVLLLTADFLALWFLPDASFLLRISSHIAWFSWKLSFSRAMENGLPERRIRRPRTEAEQAAASARRTEQARNRVRVARSEETAEQTLATRFLIASWIISLFWTVRR